jgi:hypothetical protein
MSNCQSEATNPCTTVSSITQVLFRSLPISCFSSPLPLFVHVLCQKRHDLAFEEDEEAN